MNTMRPWKLLRTEGGGGRAAPLFPVGKGVCQFVVFASLWCWPDYGVCQVVLWSLDANHKVNSSSYVHICDGTLKGQRAVLCPSVFSRNVLYKTNFLFLQC